MLRNKKAWMRLVEVALVAGLVMSYMVYLEHTRASDVQPSKDVLVLKRMGWDAIRNCDINGSIRGNLADPLYRSAIETCFNATLPSAGVGYSLMCFNTSDTYEVVAGSSLPGGDTQMIAVEYVIARKGVLVARDYTSLRLLVWFKQ